MPKGGARPGAGRPADVEIQARREAFRKSVNDAKILNIIKKQAVLAEMGDLSAAKFIMDGLFGLDTVKQTIDINSCTPEQALAILAANGDAEANSRVK